MNLKHLRKRVAKLAGPPAPCPACAARPTLVEDEALAGPCERCGAAYTGVLVVRRVVASRAELAQARAEAEAAGVEIITDAGRCPLLDQS